MKITPHNVKELAAVPGGHKFTAFVDTLIRTEAAVQGVARTDIKTNLKTNVADKGVDTRVKVRIPSERSKWMEYPTIWQYKASPFGDVTPSLEKEVDKEYSAKCIAKGYAYRLAVCDSMPDATVEDWNKLLTERAHKINPNAPAAMTVHADDLADWANEYPALLMRHFHQNLPFECVHLDTWRKNVLRDTPQYLAVPENLDLSKAIREHTDFSFTPPDVILAIIGESGVGKTRLVFEALKNRQLDGLVLYCDDEASAHRVARMAASSDNDWKLIIVADESSSSSRESLRRVLKGFSERLRVIAIESTGSQQVELNPHFKVNRPTLIQLEKILEENFPAVASERRNTYAKLCERFIQPAADLCKYDSQLGMTSFGTPATISIRDYFHFRVSVRSATW